MIEVDGVTHHDENVILKDEVRDEELGVYDVCGLRVDALDVVRNVQVVLRVIENWMLDFEEKNGVEERVLRRRS